MGVVHFSVNVLFNKVFRKKSYHIIDVTSEEYDKMGIKHYICYRADGMELSMLTYKRDVDTVYETVVKYPDGRLIHESLTNEYDSLEEMMTLARKFGCYKYF